MESGTTRKLCRACRWNDRLIQRLEFHQLVPNNNWYYWSQELELLVMDLIMFVCDHVGVHDPVDACKVEGWSMSTCMKAQLVCDALKMAA